MLENRPQPEQRSRPCVTRGAWPMLVFLAITASVCLTTGPAHAQEKYRFEEGIWAKQHSPSPDTPEGRLQAVRAAMAADQAEQALELVELWLEDYPQHEMLAEAYLLRADAKVLAKEYFKSLFDYEYVIRQFPESPQFESALEREYRVAKLFASGVKRKFLGMRILSAAGEAEEIFIRIQERSPGSEIGEQASLSLGDFYFDRSQMTSAAEAYELFLLNYPDSQYRQRAMLRLIQANLATFKGPRFDPTGLIESQQRIKTFQQEFPAAAQQAGVDAMLVRIGESLALKSFYTAQWYQKRGQRVSAVYLYRRVVRDYPQTAAAQSAIERLADMKETAVIAAEDPFTADPAGQDGRRGQQ